MDELDLTDVESKAIHEEIKDYILEHSGVKVCSLYIASDAARFPLTQLSVKRN